MSDIVNNNDERVIEAVHYRYQKHKTLKNNSETIQTIQTIYRNWQQKRYRIKHRENKND